MKYSFKIGSAWGIPIELHVTFIILMGVALLLSYPDFYFFALILPFTPLGELFKFESRPYRSFLFSSVWSPHT